MMLASLNYPNIATLYGFESVNIDEKGVGAGFIPARGIEREGMNPSPTTVHMLVMELIEGELLDRPLLIPEGGMPVERIVEIGTALAEALPPPTTRASSTATSNPAT